MEFKLDIEKVFLNFISQDKEKLKEALSYSFDTNYFLNKENIIYFDWIRKYWNKYSDIPNIEFIKERIEIIDISKHNFDFVLDSLRKRLVKNNFVKLMDRFGEYIKNDFDLEELNKKIYKELFIVTKNEKKSYIDVNEISQKRVEKYFEDIKNNTNNKGILTKIEFLDNLTYGIKPEDLVVVLSDMGVGKTWFLLYLALKAWEEGNSVLFFSLEMSQSKILTRLESLICNIAPTLILKGLMNKEELTKYSDVLIKLKENPNKFIIIENVDGCSEILSSCEFHKEMNNVKIIFIDQLTHISRNTSGTVDWQVYTKTIQDLKQLVAKKTKLPVVVASQLNVEYIKQYKKNNDYIPSKEHTAFSYAIMREADLVLALFKNKKMKEEHVLGTEILKYRDGDIDNNSTFFLDWNFFKDRKVQIGERKNYVFSSFDEQDI